MSKYLFNKIDNSRDELDKLNFNKVIYELPDKKPFIKNQNNKYELNHLNITKDKEIQ